MQDILPTYFSPDELSVLREMEGHCLQGVVYTIWKNITQVDHPYQALDWISLELAQGVAVDFYAGADVEGIQVKPLNYALLQTQVLQQFNGQVAVEQLNMSASPVWGHLIGSRIEAVALMSPYPDLYQNHVLQLQFAQDTIEITLGEEGLLAYSITSSNTSS